MPEQIRALLHSALTSEHRLEVSVSGFRRAAVLVPLILSPSGVEVLLTRRTEDVETHKGQVAFPGGMVDSEDRDIIHTALREAWEELGIPESSVEVVGLLGDFPTPTSVVITPVVGILDFVPPLRPNPDEVAEAFQMPLGFFADSRHARSEIRELLGKKHTVWYYDSGKHVVWGATAIIIRSLLERLGML